ncbi:MAG: hypothetical protein U1A25_02235, partial [Candidatus Sungbacteria bacterium]|nr:hypothetical protein [Candidatus Sungbacteria bacterium]
QEIVRLIDDKDTIHTSEGGPANSVAPFSTDEVVLMFTVPNDTRNIQLMVGSPVHPDAIYEIDFTTRMVRQKQVPQGRYLRLIAPLESQSLCIGNNLKIGWESNDIHGISIFIHELGYASWFIGKFPAELNETGERGKGEFIWKIGYTKEGKKIDTLKEDATYDIQISSTDADKPVIQDNSKATFTIMNCQG